MKLLVDSHALIWAVDDTSRLSASISAALQDPANDLLLSSATFWEIGIKVGLKKLTLSRPFRDWMKQAVADLDLAILPISIEHAATQADLPDFHRDPFDRMLIAQAIAERISIASADALFDKYGVQRLW